MPETRSSCAGTIQAEGALLGALGWDKGRGPHNLPLALDLALTCRAPIAGTRRRVRSGASTGTQLLFVDYFDWDDTAFRDFQYYLAHVAWFEQHRTWRAATR